MLQQRQQTRRRRRRSTVLDYTRWAHVVGLILLLSLSSLTHCAEAKKSKKEYPDYIYKENPGLVKEYNRGSETNPDRPAFLFSENNGPRVVEFYSPVCPHCRKFRDQYVQLAERVNRIVREENGGAATTNGHYEPIEFHAISCRPNHALCKSFGLKAFPQFRLFAANATNVTTSIRQEELHPLYILEKLGVRAGNYLKRADDNSNTGKGDMEQADFAYNLAIRTVQSWLRPQQTAGEDVHHHTAIKSTDRTNQQIFDDAYMSFDYTLRNSIFTSNGPLEKDAKQALRRWLELLHRSLPRPFVAQHVTEELLTNFENVSMAEDNLLAILDKFDPPVGEWSPGCTKGIDGMGYTCGLWSLFHIVSVGMVEWNRLLPASTSRVKPMSIPSGKAADTLRDFIYHFFNCEECRVQFIKEYDSCSLDRCDLLTNAASTAVWKRFPIWLSAMHNSVNDRLAAGHNQTVKQSNVTGNRWPLPQACPTCWTEGEQRWDENQVYKFLRVEYWPEDSTTIEYQKDLGLHKNPVQVETQDETDTVPPAIFSWMRAPVLCVLLVAVILRLQTEKKIVDRRKGLMKKLQSFDDGGDLSDHEEESRALSPLKSPRRRLNIEKPANILSPRRRGRVRQEDHSPAAQETDEETEASSLLLVSTISSPLLFEDSEKGFP